MENELQKLRKEIDSIDRKMVQLLGQRFRVTEKVGILKSKADIPCRDAKREKDHLNALEELAKKEGIDWHLIYKIWRLIINKVVDNHQKIKLNK